MAGPGSDAAVNRLMGASAEHIGGRRQWWLRPVTDAGHRRALAGGLAERRRIHQLRRRLPASSTDLVTRPFDPERDSIDWLRVNAAAFAAHPDQGTWGQADLSARLAETWVDLDGFLVHDGADGRLDAFCWTKVHQVPEALGEIYVIGVDPPAGGRGLGRAIVLAGLADLYERRGQNEAMLYVESDNLVAVGLYRSLGFELHHDDAAYEPTHALESEPSR